MPLLCNPYTYVPVLNWNMWGRRSDERRHSLAQLTAVYRPEEAAAGLVVTQFYSYRSLLTFKIMKEAPLAYREALPLMRLLMNLFGILGINHDDVATSHKTCRLQSNGQGEDILEVDYEHTAEELRCQEQGEKAVLRCFRKLACWPLGKIHPPSGSSIHYAGTLPMSRDDRPLTCDRECRLRGTRSVYLADGSAFPYLPAKGLTLTIMANANRVAGAVARDLAGQLTERRAA